MKGPDRYCSTSIRWHLARGLAAAVCIGSALRFVAEHPFAAIAGILAAMFLLRGCPMCWLLGLLDRIATRKPQVNRYKDTTR